MCHFTRYHSNSCMKYSCCIFISANNTLFLVYQENSHIMKICKYAIYEIKKSISRCKSFIHKSWLWVYFFTWKLPESSLSKKGNLQGELQQFDTSPIHSIWTWIHLMQSNIRDNIYIWHVNWSCQRLQVLHVLLNCWKSCHLWKERMFLLFSQVTAWKIRSTIVCLLCT